MHLNLIFCIARAALAGLLLLTACATTRPEPPPSPLGAAAQKWASTTWPPAMLDFFRGTFDKIGVVVEGGESFTVTHLGDHVVINGGVDQGVDLTVPITAQHVDGLVERAADGHVDGEDAYAIMAVLFLPASRAFLTGPFLAHDAVLAAADVETLIHVTLLDPAGADGPSLTLEAKGDQWVVSDGLSGTPKRKFRVTAVQSQEYMREAFKARKGNNPAAWIAFGDWYKKWRETTSSKPTG
jgi:hypothetical protein